MLNNKERQLKEPANLSHQNSAALHVALYGIRLLYKLKVPLLLAPTAKARVQHSAVLVFALSEQSLPIY
jgi:hypothetical protein